MIKIVLIVYALTAQGPAAQEVAEFKHKDAVLCEQIGTLVVKELEATGRYLQVTHRCKPFTNI